MKPFRFVSLDHAINWHRKSILNTEARIRELVIKKQGLEVALARFEKQKSVSGKVET